MSNTQFSLSVAAHSKLPGTVCFALQLNHPSVLRKPTRNGFVVLGSHRQKIDTAGTHALGQSLLAQTQRCSGGDLGASTDGTSSRKRGMNQSSRHSSALLMQATAIKKRSASGHRSSMTRATVNGNFGQSCMCRGWTKQAAASTVHLKVCSCAGSDAAHDSQSSRAQHHNNATRGARPLSEAGCPMIRGRIAGSSRLRLRSCAAHAAAP